MGGRFFAPCNLGLEPALAHELERLGASDLLTLAGGIRFQGDQRLGYAANLWLRSAIRVQELIGRFRADAPKRLYGEVRRVDWSRFLTVDQTLAVDASVRDSKIRHSKYTAALVVKDAIVDQFRERCGQRPSVDRAQPDLPLKLVVQNDTATLYRNLSGASLHKRGWRPVQVKSPLNEATAAGLLILSGWDQRSPLVDPMCGSGTFVIEAAMLAADIAPGLSRRFPFQSWPDFDAELWRGLREEADRRARDSLPFAITGADRHPGAIALARQGARTAGVEGIVRFLQVPLSAFDPPTRPGIVVVNPPYGERIGEGDDLVSSWRDLGGFLHKRCEGAVAWVLSGNRELTRHLGLKVSEKHTVRNGPIDCRFLRYDVWSATKDGPAP